MTCGRIRTILWMVASSTALASASTAVLAAPQTFEYAAPAGANSSPAARQVPGFLFTGETDLAFRNEIIRGIFSINRRTGALWALVEEPGVGHVVNRSEELAIAFFDEVIPLRLGDGATGVATFELRSLDSGLGYYGSLDTWEFTPISESDRPRVPVAWLASERLAIAWQEVRRGEPF